MLPALLTLVMLAAGRGRLRTHAAPARRPHHQGAGRPLGDRLRCSACCPGARPTPSAGWPRTSPAVACSATAAGSSRCALRSRRCWSAPARPGSPVAGASARRGPPSPWSGRCCRWRSCPTPPGAPGERCARRRTPTTTPWPALRSTTRRRRPAGAAVHELPRAGVEPRPQGARPAAALPPAQLPGQRPARRRRPDDRRRGPPGARGARGAPRLRPRRARGHFGSLGISVVGARARRTELRRAYDGRCRRHRAVHADPTSR